MIKFLDLHKVNQRFEEQFQTQFKLFFEKGWYVLGEEVAKFEQSFATLNNAKYAIGVGDGLDALVLLFRGYIETGVLKKGDGVIVAANTYIATILAIHEAGLKPVLVEPDEDSFTISPLEIEKKITSKTKCIAVVHLYGQLANMNAIEAIGFKYNLLIIEDCAQSHGINNTTTNSKAFSFYPGKNLGALGDGGAVVTNDENLYKVILRLRNYGSIEKYKHELKGFNSRLDEIQALFLNIKLPSLLQDNELRRNIAKRYSIEIQNPKIELPKILDFDKHVFHLYVIRTKNRDDFKAYLLANEIETQIHYPIPPHKQAAFFEWNQESFPITEQIHEEVLSLPISPVLTEVEVSKIIRVINSY